MAQETWKSMVILHAVSWMLLRRGEPVGLGSDHRIMEGTATFAGQTVGPLDETEFEN